MISLVQNFTVSHMQCYVHLNLNFIIIYTLDMHTLGENCLSLRD